MAQPKTRNHLVVGKNSKSYDEKHPENPVSLRPIHDAVLKVKRNYFTRNDYALMSALRRLGSQPRMVIAKTLKAFNG